MAGELIVKNGLRVSGSITATAGLTGSFSGSISNATTASYALTASVLLGSVTSASFAATASSVNALSQSVLISGSLRALTVEPTNLATDYFPKKSGTFLTSSVLNSTNDTTLHWGPPLITPSTPNSRDINIWGLNYASILPRVSGSTGNDGYMMQARPGGGFAFSNIANNTQIFSLASDVAVTALTALGSSGNISMGQSGGNVGINWSNGYTIPAKFYVSGSSRFDGNVSINGASTNSLTVKGSGTTSATNALLVQNANTSASLVVRDDSNVGIGTPTPGYRLEICGSPTNATINLAKSDGDQYLRFIGGSGGANQLIQTAYNLGIDVGGAGTRVMTFISGSGNVGIGTTTPSQLLTVQGNISASGDLNINSGTNQIWIGDGFADDNASGTFKIYNNNISGIISTYFYNSSLELRAGVSSSGFVSNWTKIVLQDNQGGSGGIRFFISGSERMTLTNTGNFGIGTTNPTQKLTVAGGLFLTGSSLSAPLILSDGNYIYGGGSTASANAIFGVTSNQTELYARNNRIGIWSQGGGTNYLYGKDGNFGIGIGVSTPAARLQVRGSGTTSATTAFRVENANASASFTVRDDGYVGIGTTSPNSQLEVVTGANAIRFGGVNGRILGAYTSGSLSNFDFYAVQTYFNSDFLIEGGKKISTANGSTANLYLTTNDATKSIYIDRSVGIGATSPLYTLHVSGSGNFINGLTITGSVIATSFTGSLLGTASTASYWSGSILNATSASYALSSSFAVSSSRAVSSSFASTASYWSGSITNATSASFGATASYVNTLNQSVIATGNIESQATLKSMYQAGDEGGEIFLNAPATNTTIPNGVTIDVYQNRLRIFEQGGSANGYYLDMPSGGPGVSTDLKPAGYTGTVNILGNPPGQQFLNYVDGILISVT